MDYRKLVLISWRAGFDIRDCPNRAFRCIAARRARKRAASAWKRELIDDQAGVAPRRPDLSAVRAIAGGAGFIAEIPIERPELRDALAGLSDTDEVRAYKVPARAGQGPKLIIGE